MDDSADYNITIFKILFAEKPHRQIRSEKSRIYFGIFPKMEDAGGRSSEGLKNEDER